MHVKTKALELIENYNLNGKHYKVIPRKEFGEDFFDGQYFFLADYHLDSENRFQKKTIGFKQRGEDFFEYYGKGNLLNVDGAIKSLERQLSEIPLKQFT